MIDSLSEEELFKPHMRKWKKIGCNLKYRKISQKPNENFVVGYTFNLCENDTSIVILKQNITNQ